jgi:DNA repair protein RadD
MIGRVLRPAEGKRDAIILDHAGAVFQHGFAEDEVEWVLSPDLRSNSAAHAVRREPDSKSRLVECTQCSAMRVAGEPCPACGFLPAPPPRPVPIGDGELGHVTEGRAQAHEYDPVARERWHGMLIHIAAERGYRPGWAAVNFKEKFGEWPPRGSNPRPILPTPEVRSWVRSRLIAYAKHRGAA